MFRISGKNLSSIIIVACTLFTVLFSQMAMAQTATPTSVPALSQVEVTGVIDAINGSNITIAQQIIDVSQAEVKITLEVGMRIKVEGTLAADDHIVAHQVKQANNAATIGAESEIVGILASIDGSTMVIGGQIIDVSRAQINPGVVVNETVEAKVSLINGILFAREVQLAAFSGDHSAIDLPADCVAAQPTGWTNYTIQAGDSLSSIANGSDTSLRQLAFVNCIANAGSIVTGTTIFVPQIPVLTDDNGQDGPGHDIGDDNGQDSSGHDVGDDNGQDSTGHDVGDDHSQDGSGHDAGDDHGGNSNSGHG
ncbi:MAG: DUF5666 domain-containing protein [Chloroflexota bacterium]